MKTLLVIAFCVLVAGCDSSPNGGYSGASPQSYETIVIEQCQYIQVVNGPSFANFYSYSLTHKGNCNNPIHKR